MTLTEMAQKLTLRHVNEIWMGGNLALADDLFTADYVFHNPTPGIAHNLDGLKQAVKMYRQALPDLHYDIDDIFAVADKVVVRWTLTGTHQGSIMDTPATGNSICVTGITIERVVEDKIAETWVEADALKLFAQLGIISLPE